PVSADFGTVGGTAVPVTGGDGDFYARRGQVTIPAGQDQTSIAVRVFPDHLDEFNETFSLLLNALKPSSELLFAVNGGVARATRAQATIVDNDVPAGVAVRDASEKEADLGTEPMAFRVQLSEPSGK